MERDYTTKGTVLIRIWNDTDSVSADPVNFSISWKEMVKNEHFRKAYGVSGGPFCLAPWELDIPF